MTILLDLDPTLLPALDAVTAALERGPRVGIDRRQLLNSMQRMDHEMRTRRYPSVFEDEQQDAAEFFAEQQCPSDASFR